MARWLLIAMLIAGCQGNQTPPGMPADAELPCLPNLDGVLSADELPVVLDRETSYLVDSDIAVELAGTQGATGTEWHFDSAAAARIRVAPHAIAGTDLVGIFPGSAFSVPGDDGSLGVYSVDDEALWLHGFATVGAAADPADSSLVYAAPVALLRFPLGPGDAFTSVGELDTNLAGTPVVRTDTYEVSVVDEGQVLLPAAAIGPALRVSTRVTTSPLGGQAVVTQQTSFYFECFGEITRAQGRIGESQRDFDVASTLRRLDL